MAYDSARGKVVLFGGVSFSSGGQLSDTWEYDGTHWVEQPVPGPPLRQNHAMAYDSARGRVVLFGGYSNGIRMSDAWEWNGTA